MHFSKFVRCKCIFRCSSWRFPLISSNSAVTCVHFSLRQLRLKSISWEVRWQRSEEAFSKLNLSTFGTNAPNDSMRFPSPKNASIFNADSQRLKRNILFGRCRKREHKILHRIQTSSDLSHLELSRHLIQYAISNL